MCLLGDGDGGGTKGGVELLMGSSRGGYLSKNTRSFSDNCRALKLKPGGDMGK